MVPGVHGEARGECALTCPRSALLPPANPDRWWRGELQHWSPGRGGGSGLCGCWVQLLRAEASFTQDPDFLWNGLSRNQEQSVLFGTRAELVFPFSKRCEKGSPPEKITSLMVIVAVVVDMSGYPGTRCIF